MTAISDAFLELRIQVAMRLMLAADVVRRRSADEFASLIRRRSPRRVRAMEEKRGIR